MKWDTLEEEPCSVARTVAVIGDRWSLLILRECFLRKRRFEAFQSSLGITRHLLADRLKKLVRYGVLRRIPYQEFSETLRIYPDPKGPRSLSGDHVDSALGQYPHGRCSRAPDASRAQELGKMFDPLMVCSDCGEPLAAKGVHVHPGPGARQTAKPIAKPQGTSKAKKTVHGA